MSWPFVRASCWQKRTRPLASDAVRAIKRARTTCSAPALITARRRSYFTRRSSIIHAVNNAPLFRVTLYREKGKRSPSFLPCPFPTFCKREERGGIKSLPRGKTSSGRDEVGGAYPVETLLSPGLSTETETRFGLTAREES